MSAAVRANRPDRTNRARWLTRFAAMLARVSLALAALLTAMLAVLITVVVCQRFLAHTTPRWAEELPRLVLVWAAWVGAAACSQSRAHLVAGLLPYVVRHAAARRWVERFNHALILLVLIALGMAGGELAHLTMGQSLSALALPAGLVYLAVPVACAVSALVHVAQLVQPDAQARGEVVQAEVVQAEKAQT